MRTPILKGATLAAAMLICSCGASPQAPGEGDRDANARAFELHPEKNFAKLINAYTVGKIEPTPWAGWWWAYTSNGIAKGIGSASPAGRYDAARGQVHAAQDWEARYHGSHVKDIRGWFGHCNGWCAAAALFPEPHGEVKVNGITFGVADLKALLSEAGMSTSAEFFGDRCDNNCGPQNPKYLDTVPDQYFLVLTNFIGKNKQAVLIDRFTGDEIWNQPLAGYKMEYPTKADYLGADPAAPGVYRINITSKMYWMDDGVAPDVDSSQYPFDFQERTLVSDSRELRMELWLDAPVVFDDSGKIVSSGDVIVTKDGENYAGGAWKMGTPYSDGWPDYMWVPYSMIASSDQEQDYINPYIDINWIKAHLLVPGGLDDPNSHPTNLPTVPPASPGPWPTDWPTSGPTTHPTWTSQPVPIPTPHPHPPLPGPMPTHH